MFVCACIFQRRKDSKWEDGVAIGEDEASIETIVSKKTYQAIIKRPWDLALMPYDGCLVAFPSKE